MNWYWTPIPVSRKVLLTKLFMAAALLTEQLAFASQKEFQSFAQYAEKAGPERSRKDCTIDTPVGMAVVEVHTPAGGG